MENVLLTTRIIGSGRPLLLHRRNRESSVQTATAELLEGSDTAHLLRQDLNRSSDKRSCESMGQDKQKNPLHISYGVVLLH